MQLALYQPDIPQNVGSILRLSACFDVALHIIEPCGFILDDKRIRRAGMDYIEQAIYMRHSSWQAFGNYNAATSPPPRIILLTTKSNDSLFDFSFAPSDILLLGQESAGVPDAVASACDARITIPINAAVRSLNVAQAAAIALAEGLRQTQQLPCKQ